MHVAGRMHPMVLHFPIALLIVSLLIEWLTPKDNRGKDDLRMEFLLSFTAFSAAATSLFGLILFHTGEYEEGSTLQWHKWLGILVSLFASLLVWLRRRQKIIYHTLFTATVVATLIAGHMGASITHGENFLVQPLEFEKKTIEDIDNAIVFSDIIQPILNEKCVGCHNPNKSKGELQLISKQTILRGGEDGAVILPGSPDSSMLYTFLLLPMDDEKHMPPEGKPQLDQGEINLIKWWIHHGAGFDHKVVEVNTPDTILQTIKSKYSPESPLDAFEIPFADQETIRSLNNESRGVRQLSLDKPYIDVFLGGKEDFSSKDIDELKPIAKQIISIDLSNSSIKDEHLKSISQFTYLQRIHLENTDITGPGIKNLSGLKHLEYINISGTAVTEKILDELLKFPELQKAFFYETEIPVKNLLAFQKNKTGLIIGYTPDLSTDSSFHGKLTSPTVKVDSTLFTNFATVEMSYRLKGVQLHYTTNGNEPDSLSPVYKRPILIDSTCVLKVIAMRKGWESSPAKRFSFMHARYRFEKARLSNLPDKRYMANLDTTLIDLQRGSDTHGDGKYIGYEGEDVTVFLDLGELKQLSSISLGYIINHGAYVISPASMTVSGSTDNKSFLRIGAQQNIENKFIGGSSQGLMTTRFPTKKLRYLQVKVSNSKILPAWHPNKGSKSWMFLDEIIVN